MPYRAECAIRVAVHRFQLLPTPGMCLIVYSIRRRICKIGTIGIQVFSGTFAILSICDAALQQIRW